MVIAGQDQIADVLPVPAPGAGAAGAGADGGQPVELHREDDHQHHAEPVMRHRDAGDRDRGRDLVDPGVAEIAGDQAEEQAEREADQRGRDRQRHGVADRAHDFAQHRPAGGDRIAEIAVERLPQPEPELHRQRPVEAVGDAQLRRQFLRRVGGQDRHQRIAGRDVHQQEAHQRHAERRSGSHRRCGGRYRASTGYLLLPFSPCGRRWRARHARRMSGFYPRMQIAECEAHPRRQPLTRLRFAKPPSPTRGEGRQRVPSLITASS